MQSCLDNRASGWQRVAVRFSDVKLVRVALALVMGALGSIPLVLLTPPFQVPDEVQQLLSGDISSAIFKYARRFSRGSRAARFLRSFRYWSNRASPRRME